MSKLDSQRKFMVSNVTPTDATVSKKAYPQVMTAYLTKLGYAQKTLPEKLAAWAKNNGVPTSKASTTIGT